MCNPPLKKNMKAVLGNAHEDHLCRIAAGEDASALMDTLVSQALAELRSLMQ